MRRSSDLFATKQEQKAEGEDEGEGGDGKQIQTEIPDTRGLKSKCEKLKSITQENMRHSSILR